ncbi:hypothetical protein QWY99_08615 [Flavobacterium branchiarum]|uniref:Uncharacterized protein n=1 Tax=Flavobacterium branchiarum TaxID=1114870 RepID=A0ABV5FPZ0_9FLAO|nr:hypothetical protein [Flavobacterium branchiarum]MDN3673108.1 hypothetical protein [Flavobacterium branchiarum]
MKTATQENITAYLIELLQSTKNKEDFILEFWELWTLSVTTTTREFQQVFANTLVNKWFITELAKEEKEFKLLSDRYPESTGTDKDKLYCECINKLMSRFPMSLLQNAKKRTEKPKTTIVEGIRTEISILNQN